VRQPTVPNLTDYIYATDAGPHYDRVMGYLEGVDTVSAVRVWGYGRSEKGDWTLCQVSKDGVTFTGEQVIIPDPSSYAWRNVYWDSLGWVIGGQLNLRVQFNRGDYTSGFVTRLAATYAEITYEPLAAEKYLVEGSMALPGVQRRARENEMRWVSRVLSDSIVGKVASPQTVEIPVGDLSWPWAVGDRVRIRITSLSAGYVKGGVLGQDVIIA